MRIFDIQYSEDLLEINKRLKTEKDKKIKNQLQMDRKVILNYLCGNKDIEKFTYNKTLNKDQVISFIINNQLRDIKLDKIKISYVNTRKLVSLTKLFIEKPELKLINTYKKIISYDGLKIRKRKSKYLGVTRYIKSLDKNYIEIQKQNKIIASSTLIHELGHARANHICHGENKYFQEVYPIFLELVFSDFLKENGLTEESYSLKLLILEQLKVQIKELHNELNDYLNRSDEKVIDNYFFEYKYKVLRDIVIALNIYDMYLLNSEETLIKLDYFILNSGTLIEEELLKLLDIDNYILNNNKIIYKMYNNLHKKN